MSTQKQSQVRNALLTTVALLSIGTTGAIAQAAPQPSGSESYSFQLANFPGDTFTQLLDINNEGTIAGYHGAGTTAQNPNKGFTLTLPRNFTNENFPNSVQTQVVGINNRGNTGGFYIDLAGTTHGFIASKDIFSKVDAPKTAFNQILGLNDYGFAAGYSSTDPAGATKQLAYIENQGKFLYLTSLFPKGTGNTQATDINNDNKVSGFYVDAKNVTHGFIVNYEDSHKPTLKTIDFPGATSTQVLGINNHDQLSGVYTDAANQSHGFVDTDGHFQSIDVPMGIGTTTINGINDEGRVVGFFVDGVGNTEGFEASPPRH